MAFVTGITRYVKKGWMDVLAAKTLKIALYSTTTGLDANQDPASPLVYTTTGELTASGTGYTTGGYSVANAVVSYSGGAYRIDFDDIETGSGTIASGTYGAMIYDTLDSNRAISVHSVSVTVGSNETTLSITIPADALYVS
jgi:ABC-type uncharacterized transport system permease subunit